jgi:hypothetical protein
MQYTMMNDSKIAQSGEEKNNLKDFVIQTNDIPGDVVEVGVYEGGTASLIFNYMNQSKNLYLFDTFDQFDGAGEYDPEWIRPKDHVLVGPQKEAYPYIVEHFKPYPNVAVIKGDFPAVIGKMLDSHTFSFVHLDVDIYLPTLNSLRLFYPRMSKGGIILTHDYYHSNLQGVKKAFDDFFSDKPEKIICKNPSGQMSQAYIIKE